VVEEEGKRENATFSLKDRIWGIKMC